jgi:transposase
VIGALIGKVLLTVSMFNCVINADCFYAWTVQDLLPKIQEKSVIVMDNATFHKRKDIVQAIEEQGHILEWLPPYSPDLNPIEPKWSQAKSLKRKLQSSIESLFKYNHL